MRYAGPCAGRIRCSRFDHVFKIVSVSAPVRSAIILLAEENGEEAIEEGTRLCVFMHTPKRAHDARSQAGARATPAREGAH